MTRPESSLSFTHIFGLDEIDRGKRKINSDYYYIFEPKNSRHVYRHLLFLAWNVSRVAKDHNRIFMCGSVHKLDKATSEIMKSLYLTRIPCIFETIDRLYWDDIKKGPRTGRVGQQEKPGDLMYRLPVRMRQLEKTYDLYSLTADKLIQLLGKEFQFDDMKK